MHKDKDYVIDASGIRAKILVGGTHADTIAAALALNEILTDDFLIHPLEVESVSSPAVIKDESSPVIMIATLADAHLLEPWQEKLAEDIAFLRHQDSPQAYVIRFFRSEPNKPYDTAVLLGADVPGTVYAAVSFAQLAAFSDTVLQTPVVSIRDYPDFEHRWGGGSTPKDAVRHKINIAPYRENYVNVNPSSSRHLGVNQDAARYGPGTVRPVIGYMNDFGLKNRESYPDGQLYECIEEVAFMGLCPGNEELRTLRMNVLRQQIERNEPTALYIHHVDHDTYDRTLKSWINRHPGCRERWPNDVLEAEDGMAGAMAHEFNSILKTIAEVKKENGYDGERDCLVLAVIAPYGRWSEPDDAWERIIEYYVQLSRMLPEDANILFVLREQGPRQNGGAMRIREISDALQEYGNGHEVFVYQHLGDIRRTALRRWPVLHQSLFSWLPSPTLSASFDGANGIMMLGASDTALRAEYLWNKSPNSGPLANYSIAPNTRSEWGAAFTSMISGNQLPDEIFAPGGFFDKVWSNRYGNTAGTYLANGKRPTLFRNQTIAPVLNDAWLRHIYAVWRPEDQPQRHGEWTELFTELKRSTTRALEGLKLALEAPDLKPGRRDELLNIEQNLSGGLIWVNAAILESKWYNALWSGSEYSDDIRQKLEKHSHLLNEYSLVSTFRDRLDKAPAEIETSRQHSGSINEYLAELRANAPTIRNTLQRELTQVHPDLQVVQLQVLGYTRIAVVGQAFSHLLNDEVLGFIERVGIRDAFEPGRYDVVCLDLPHRDALGSEQLESIRSFIANGGGLMIASATPFRMLNSANLDPIADWLGARRYGNSAGNIIFMRDTNIFDGYQEWINAYIAPGGTAGLSTPVTGIPLISFQRHQDLSFMLANRYRRGRVLYTARADLPAEINHRILLWLFGNRLSR